jgi:hypothetical protein
MRGVPEDPSPRTAARPWVRSLVVAAFVAVLAAWGVALWYSLTRGGPEPLSPSAQQVLAGACGDALAELRAMPDLDGGPVDPARLTAETAVLAGIVRAGRAAVVPGDDGADALAAWLDDWDALLAARAEVAAQRARGTTRRLVVPTDDRGRPVTVRMDEYARYHGLADCSPITLQAEVIDGARFYPTADRAP